MADYDKVLADLTVRAQEVASSGSDEERASFDSTLQQLASGKTKDPNLRQAAMQLRLPDVNVGRNADGNLSFSKPLTTNAHLPRDFAATATVVKPGETVIVGDESGVLGYTAPQRQTTSAVTPDNLAKIGDSATSPVIKGLSAQIAALDKIEDPRERQDAFLNLTQSISLARASREVELVNARERELGVPQLEEQLRREEMLDRQDEKWQANQVDSPITAEIRQRLRVAKADAYTYGSRDIQVDPVITQLTAEVGRAQKLIELDAAEKQRADTKADKQEAKYADSTDFFTSATPEAQTRGRAFVASLQGKPIADVSDTDMVRYLKSNADVQAVMTMDVPAIIAVASDPTNPSNKYYSDTLRAMDVVDDPDFLMEHMKAIKEITAAGGIEGLSPDTPEKTRQMARDQRMQQILASSDSMTKYAGTKEEKQAAQSAQLREQATLALRMYMESKVAEIPGKMMDLPEPSDPALLPVWQSVQSKGSGLKGILGDEATMALLDTGDPQQLQSNIDSIINYIMPLYRSKAPTQYGSYDPLSAVEQDLRQRLQHQATRIAGKLGPLEIMSTEYIWNWPGEMAASAFRSFRDYDSQYAKFIRGEN